MNSKEANAKVKQELKSFFKANKAYLTNQQNKKYKDEVTLTQATEFEISDKTLITQRIKALKELSEVVLNHQLEEYALEKICRLTEDILRSSSKDHRHAVLHFFQCLVQGQYNHLGILRYYFFNIVKSTEYMDDVIPKFELFQKLTDNGKDLLFFEVEAGHFLLNWTPVIVAAGKAIEFLKTLVNYIKYNAAYTDDEIINGIVQYMAYLCCQSDIEEVVVGGLNVLDAIVCYSNISQQTMPVFISALSRTVCLSVYNAASWKIMRNLLGTHMGHFCLQTMCKMLQDSNSYTDIGLICGMIFNINMALLHNKPDFIIVYIPNSVLPSIEKAAESKVPVIIMEVCACIKWMIEKYGKELKDPLWGRMFSILDTLLNNIDTAHNKNEYQRSVLDLFSRIDALFESNQFKGDTANFYRLVYKWYPMITESLVIRLIDYSSKFVMPIEENWVTNLQSLVLNFFEKETRKTIRIHMLNKFEDVLMSNRYHYEKNLIDLVITSFFSNIAYESDPIVRKAVIEFLLRFSLQCSNVYMEPMLDILEKVLQAPFDDEKIADRCQKDCSDMLITLKGLIEIFIVTIYQLPSTNAIKVMSMLVAFLQRHYEKPYIFESVIEIRLMVAECLLKLRSDSRYRLGYCTDTMGLKFSSFLIVEHRRPSNISLSAVSSMDSRSSVCSSFEEDCVTGDVTFISLSNASRSIITVLKCESDWRVLKPVLEAIPFALKYKALIISRHESDVEPLVSALISMIIGNLSSDGLRNTPPKFSKADLYTIVIPVLSAFASYHAHSEVLQQTRLIQCLEFGFVQKSAPKSVTALMICLLEMNEAMRGPIPEVLLNLSKISATKYVAIPTLEFLSMLATFPKVYANFTPVQYMSIFAVILPYTNPFKYHHYTVSLAHHVIAVWLFKCKKPMRPDFVKFIITALRTNALSSFDGVACAPNDALNEDSSSRKRSSSLTEQGNRKKERHMSSSGRLMARKGAAVDQKKDEMLILFHRELTDTCIDLMSRVAYSTCSALPRRLSSADFFLHNGQSMTWLLGMTLITITVSGCTQKPIRNGLCDKCLECCTINPGLIGVTESVNDGSGEGTDKDKANECLSNVANVGEKHADNQSSQNSTALNTNFMNSPINSNPNVWTAADEENTNENSDRNKKLLTDELEALDQCVCWCQGWAEIYVRRPTGDVSWVMRCQNELTSLLNFDPLTDLSALYHSYIMNDLDANSQQSHKDVASTSNLLTESSLLTTKSVAQRLQTSSTSASIPIPKIEDNCELIEGIADLSCGLDDKTDECCHGRNPVRRSNSSPEMSSNWKTAYMKDSSRSFNSSPVHDFEHGGEGMCSSDCRKTGKCYAKELRGNCEAIPEEFSGQGTTPPKPGILSLVAEASQGADVESSFRSSHLVACADKSPSPKSNVAMLPSFSFEDVHSKQENRFFDKHSMPNEHFEFNRSASVSQVVKKSPPAVSSISLSLASSQPHLTTKPPLSPPTYISRYSKHTKELSSADSRSDSFSQLSSDYKRNRLHTVSVMNSSKKSPMDWVESPKNRLQRAMETKKPGISPSFVFLQLYHSSHFGNSHERPLLVPSTPAIQRAMNIFDLIPPYETHKVGVIYVGPGQANNETEILRNTYGSVRYSEFLSNLGTLVNLAEVNPQNIFLGGLEQNGDDGKYAYVWKDDVMQVIFHIATLMPNKDTDVHCSNKKKHIGNDYVTIVYNDSGEEYDLHTVKCQYNFACVIIEPLDHGSNQLTVKARQDLKELIGDMEMKIVSDKNVSLLARQLALHINLASVIQSRLTKEGGFYASNWLERLRKIKHIKTKVTAELSSMTTETSDTDNKQQATDRRNNMCDFTEYTA